MNMLHPSARIAAASAAALLFIQPARAAVTTWNAVGGNWSVGTNWDTLSAPTQADDARFSNTGTGTPNVMDANRTLNSLNYGQSNGGTHTTTINPGQTLTVNRTNSGDVLSAGTGVNGAVVVSAAMSGAGGALVINGTGNLTVRQGNSANGAQMATLDLSGVDTFTATIGRLLVAQANSANDINRPSGNLILAKTNHITLSGSSPQVMVQDAGLNANGGTYSGLTFGQYTELYGDVMRLAGQKGNANITFNTAFTAPYLKMRNSDGVSPISTIDFGYNGAASSGNSTTCAADLSAGVVDLLANLVHIAQGNPGPSLGTCTGTLTLGAGTFNVNTLEIGYGNASGASGATTATLNVNNNSLLSTGTVVVVNTFLRLARTNGGTGVVSGTLNLNNGTVIATNIVSGGGVSTININAGGTLVLQSTAGSLSAPIQSFSMSDGTLSLPALNAGAVVAVKNLTVGGTQNTLNITSIPPIASYPATFTLINYQTGAGGNFALASLPPASPSYNGSLVDLGNGVVQLELTSGPVANLSLRWTGANGGSWDSFTYNWLYQGYATNFFAGAAALFDDSGTQSNVDLVESLSPGSVTVSNNNQDYFFSGSGNIAGASSLVKSGSRMLTVANQGVDVFGTVLINGGTLQLGDGGADGAISAIYITNNAALVISNSGSFSLGSAIAGSGTLAAAGSGTVVLSGANAYNGATTLSGGTLEIDQSSSGPGPLTSSPGTILSGSGTVNGSVTVGGQLNPGPVNAPGNFKAHGGLTLAAGSTLAFDLSATDPSNPAANDWVEVIGNLVLNNNSITVNIVGTPASGASYLLFTYSGSLSGNFNPVVLGTHFPASLDTSIPGSVYLNITGASGASLRWNSQSDTTWDSMTTNWTDLNKLSNSFFYSGDSVLLDDTPGLVTGITLAAGVNVYPSSITNNCTNNLFSISGAGQLGGSTSIAKSGPGLFILGTANTFTGPVDIYEGTLQVGNDTALGTTASGTTVYDGGTLDLNGHNLGGEVITVSGAGFGSQGAIVNTGGAQAQALRQIVLTGDTTFGGTGTWGVNNGGGTASLSTSGNAFNLTKTGGNQVNLAQLATLDSALGDIDIQQGTLEFSGLTPGMGDPSHTNTVEIGATLSLANTTVVWNKYFILNGNGSTTTVNVGSGGNTELAGPVELHGGCVFNVGGILLTVSGLISGDGGLIKNGGSPMVLTNVNTYTGDTTINSAALRLAGNGSISASSNIIIAAGATLTVTGRVDSAFSLAGGQTLKGNGTVNGFVNEPAGSTIAPGVDAIGMLTVSNTVTLDGTTVMELDGLNGTNDVLRCSSSISYGGTLNLVSINGPLTNGSSFKLFSATNYPGTFSAIVPATPGSGQMWDLSALGTGGTIKVVAVPSPKFSHIAASGGNVVLGGTGGPALGNYFVLASTNVSLAVSNWTRIATNSFDSSGNFSLTNGSTLPRQFFLIQLP